MQQHVCVELVGGPEDGREFIVPAAFDSTAERPESPLPFEQLTLPGPDVADEIAPPVRYRRSARRPDGVWRYDYVGEQIAAQHER